MKVKCNYCGKIFERSAYHAKKRNKHNFCSRQCYEKWSRENNPRWRKNEETLICVFCGKEFKRKQTEARKYKLHFCSKECQQNYFKGENATNWKGGKVKKICAICGKEFEATPAEADRRKCCSRKCDDKARSKRMKGENATNWKGGKIKRVCETCGKDFFVDPNVVKNNKGKFCSHECLGKWISEHKRGQNNHNWKEKEKRICRNCGIEFEIASWLVKKSGGFFCSADCYHQWFKTNMRGESNPSWQGGSSFEPYCFKFNDDLKEQIRNKYGRVCFLCAKTERENGRKMSVHHVNYNKRGGCDGTKWILVPLCNACNAKVNFGRDYWEELIRKKMKKRKLAHGQTILEIFF